MAIPNRKLLKQAVEKTIDDITVGDSVLAPQVFARFVRRMQESTVLLDEARYLPMESHRTEIDRIWFPGRVLQSGKEPISGSNASTARNSLVAEELVAVVGLLDKVSRRNIERGSIEDTVIELLGEAAGRDMEEYALFADDEIPDADPTDGDPFLRMTDGWLKLAGNVVYGNYTDVSQDAIDTTLDAAFDAGDQTITLDGKANVADEMFFIRIDGRTATQEFHVVTGADISGDDAVLTLAEPLEYDQAAGTVVHDIEGMPSFQTKHADYPTNLFNAMEAALPKRYLQDRGSFRFYVSDEVRQAYVNWLKPRETAIGDRAILGFEELTYHSIPVRRCPMLERYYETSELGGNGPGHPALLADPNNCVWGVFHEVTVEGEREAKDRRTDHVLVLEGDAHYEDEDGAVAAFIEKPAPAPA